MSRKTDAKKRYALAREIAEEGIILLKNRKGLLPLVGRTLAVFGRAQVDTIPCGTGSAFCRSDYTVNILDGLQAEGIPYDGTLAEYYRSFSAEEPLSGFGVWGTGSHLQPEPPLSEGQVEDARKRADTALFVLGRTAGENDDISSTEGDFLLSATEREQLSFVCRHFSDVILVVNSGNLIDLSFTESEAIGAVLWLSLPGMEGGSALAAVLSGRVSPSGKLTDTVARSYGDYPTADSFGKKGGLIQNYTEDIFVGYRFFESFAKEKVLYPFGFGLSYTDFALSCDDFSYDTTTVTARVTVKNIGETAGKETVMLFFAPREGLLPKPALTLCTFGKTKTLLPFESEALTLSFPRRAFASFDDLGKTGEANTWVTEAGVYSVLFGEDVRSLSLAGEVTEGQNTVWQRCVPLPTRLSERLVGKGVTEVIPHIEPDRSLGIPVPSLGKCEIAESDFRPFDDGQKHTVKLLISALGGYRVTYSGDFSVMLGGTELKNGGEAILPVGEAELALCGAPQKITLEKADDTVRIGTETSFIEGGRFSETALYVVSKRFSDDGGPLPKGRGLARMHTPGRYALYSLHVEKAGLYDVSFRYSNSHPDMDLRDAFFFLVSNVGQSIGSVTLSHTTDGEAVFRTSEPITLAFPAGDCRLKIVSATTAPPEIACLIVKPSGKNALMTEERKKAEREEAQEIESPRHLRTLPDTLAEHDLRRVARGEQTMGDFLASLDFEELAVLTSGNTEGQVGYLPAHGVREVLWADGPIGLRLAENTTIYPASAMLASTWNPALAERFGACIGREAADHDIGMLLAPAVNIHRDPLCGRSFEYSSEDPLLTAKMASAVVRGIERNPVAATVKHFAANSTEYHRMRSDSFVSARAMREIYMKAFESIIEEGDPSAIMTSYNLINGEKVPESALYCTEVMRNELCFDGVLVTDWGNNSDHVRELAAGHDLKMSFGSPERVARAMADGTLDRAKVETAAERILRLILKIDGFDLKNTEKTGESHEKMA